MEADITYYTEALFTDEIGDTIASNATTGNALSQNNLLDAFSWSVTVCF